MSTKYQPSNGTEADYFMAKWCVRCRHHSINRHDGGGCMILARTLWTDINSPDYPKEWIEDDHGPQCTAFTAKEKII